MNKEQKKAKKTAKNRKRQRKWRRKKNILKAFFFRMNNLKIKVDPKRLPVQFKKRLSYDEIYKIR